MRTHPRTPAREYILYARAHARPQKCVYLSTVSTETGFSGPLLHLRVSAGNFGKSKNTPAAWPFINGSVSMRCARHVINPEAFLRKSGVFLRSCIVGAAVGLIFAKWFPMGIGATFLLRGSGRGRKLGQAVSRSKVGRLMQGKGGALRAAEPRAGRTGWLKSAQSLSFPCPDA